MRIKTIQWNIGGGRIRKAGELPDDHEAYDLDGMGYISDLLKKYAPDIVFLQETHQNTSMNQVQELAKSLGCTFFFNDVYSDSHIEEGHGLGQGIISRFPIDSHTFEFFQNPKFETVTPSGKKWVMHDKGISRCSVGVYDNMSIEVSTLHLFPLRKFGVEWLSDDLIGVRQDIAEKICESGERFLLQGDFNYDDSSLKRLLSDAFSRGNVQEVPVEDSTTPRGRKYDHIIYKGLKHISSSILSDALTDHYPVYSEFEV